LLNIGKIDQDNFLTFYTDGVILQNYFCQQWLNALDTAAQLLLVAVSS